MKEITVTARSKAKPGKEKELEAAIREVTIATHREPGCLRYAVHRDMQDPSSFLIVERWASLEAHQAHMKTSHVLELFNKVPGLVATTPEILTFEGLSIGNSSKGTL